MLQDPGRDKRQMHGVVNTATRFETLFRDCLRIRLVEEKIIELYPSDRIQSPVHLSIGQEAVAVGTCETLRPTDLLFATYRSHAFYVAKGGDLKRMFAELYGRVDGLAKGKAGSMHLAAPEVGMMGSSAVVGTNLPHAAGAGLAARNRGTDQVIVCAFGDGATEEGVYHETLNFIALMQLPVILLCENNGLAVHASQKERQAYEIASHAQCFGIDTTVLREGYDILQVADTMGRLIAATRSDRKPRFVEISTFRYKEHVGPGDDYDAGYRSRADLVAWQTHDPLIQDRALADRLKLQIDHEIAAAVAFAENSQLPGRAELLTDVI
jgi:TPP-dependent pyruvate/acetoin dehydrogenase alpha subunit